MEKYYTLYVTLKEKSGAEMALGYHRMAPIYYWFDGLNCNFNKVEPFFQMAPLFSVQLLY